MNQQTALDILKTGANVFLTGSAGSGKTYTLNQYIHYLKARQVTVAVTASTGIAATHMNGMTIHSWSGIGIRDELPQSYIKRLTEEADARERFEHTAVLIIDEISMLHAKQFNMVNQVLKLGRQSDAAFGGLQIIVCGDFFQLPPVSRQQEPSREKFAFMAPAWVEAQFQICYLTEQHRQNDDDLDQILNAIRAQTYTQIHIDLLLQHLEQSTDSTAISHINADPQSTSNTEIITRLYTHNVDVDELNQRQLDAIEAKTEQFAAQLEGNAKLIETLKNSVRAPVDLTLKVGAKVMFVKNNFEKGYVNGTLGTVTGFKKDQEQRVQPMVTLNDGTVITVEPESWSIINEEDEILASFTQIPLRLAWAMTIHKSQGMTLESAEIDLAKTFEKGQGYVALSRLKSLAGLRLLGFQPQALALDSLACKADIRFQELSQHAAQNIRGVDLAPIHNQFIIRSGGTIDAQEIAKYKQHSKKPHRLSKAKTNSTLQDTREWFDLGLSIAEIAEKREMAESTILGHIARLAKEQQLDIERLRPTQDVLDQVRKAYKKIKKRGHDEDFNADETVKLTPLVRETEMNYADVRLAMLFIE